MKIVLAAFVFLYVAQAQAACQFDDGKHRWRHLTPTAYRWGETGYTIVEHVGAFTLRRGTVIVGTFGTLLAAKDAARAECLP